MKVYVAVIGPGKDATEGDCRDAEVAARELASGGIVIVTGGLDGVMGAAATGAASVGGLSVGLLPDPDRGRAHPDLTVAIPTGLGELRNGLVVRSADCVLAIGGSWGTLSEIALATRAGVPVVSLSGWALPEGPVTVVDDVGAAIAAVRGFLGQRPA